MPFVMQLKKEEFQKCVLRHECPMQAAPQRFTPCSNGMAGEYECSNVDLLAFVPLKVRAMLYNRIYNYALLAYSLF